MAFRGPYAFGSQAGEPWRGPYTFGEGDLAHPSPPSLTNSPPDGLTVSFSVANGEPPFVLDYNDGTVESQPGRSFDHTFADAGAYVVVITDALGRQNTKAVSVTA
jgi:hypothetical protein